jgi:hypothetical protein
MEPRAQSIRPSLARLGAVGALAGIAAEIVAAAGHPSTVQPNDSAGAFLEYARSGSWIVVHLGQLGGALLVGLAVVVLALSMRHDGRGAGALAVAGAIGAALGLAVFAVQMAVDGFGLKAGFDAWVAAQDPNSRAAAFIATDVIRSLEKGLDAVFSLLNGVSLVAIGSAILLGRRYALGLGAAAIVAGTDLAISGWLTALTGFSPEAAAVAAPAQLVFLLFLIGSAIGLLSASRSGAIRHREEIRTAPASAAPAPA